MDPDVHVETPVEGEPVEEMVPVEHLRVARWGNKELRVGEHPDIEVWLTGWSEGTSKATIRIKDGSNKIQELRDAFGYDATELTTRSVRGGICNGRPLLDDNCIISTCGGENRPDSVYRASHEGNGRRGPSAHGGTKARGFELVKVTLEKFMMFVKRHLSSTCNDPSPFMSVTTDIQKAGRVAMNYETRGYRDVKIQKIRTKGEGWNHKVQRMWNLGALVSWFKLTFREYYRNEYLIENSIPPEAVV